MMVFEMMDMYIKLDGRRCEFGIRSVHVRTCVRACVY